MLDIYEISSSEPPVVILKGDNSETYEELEEIFLKKHKEWENLNNPLGYVSGEVQKKWEERLQILLNLVRKGQAAGKY